MTPLEEMAKVILEEWIKAVEADGLSIPDEAMWDMERMSIESARRMVEAAKRYREI